MFTRILPKSRLDKQDGYDHLFVHIKTSFHLFQLFDVLTEKLFREKDGFRG